jgi:CDP-glycerol glycerophosphotransferase (TagB/SpsB family)
VLITDYSSSFIDYMLTGKPVFSFAYDFERYTASERGLFYDMEMVFPGPICRSFDTLVESLERALAAPQQEPNERYRAARSIFFDYLDDKNSERLIARVKSL